MNIQDVVDRAIREDADEVSGFTFWEVEGDAWGNKKVIALLSPEYNKHSELYGYKYVDLDTEGETDEHITWGDSPDLVPPGRQVTFKDFAAQDKESPPLLRDQLVMDLLDVAKEKGIYAI